MSYARHQHPLELRLILGSHDRQVGDAAQVGNVIHSLVRGPVGPNHAGPIHTEEDRQILDANIVDHLVKGPLQEGGIDRDHRARPLAGHACRHGHGVLFGNAHIHILVRQLGLEFIQAGAGGHSGRDRHNSRIVFRKCNQGFCKNFGVAGRRGLVGRFGLARCQVKGILSVVTHLIFFRDRVALAFGGGHVDEHRALLLVTFAEDVNQFFNVVTVNGAHVGEAQFFKHCADFRYGQALHAFFDPIEFRRQGTAKERQMLHLLFDVVRQELHRRAKAHFVQVARQGPDVGRNGHVVVVQHHHQVGVGQVTRVVNGFKGHPAGHCAVADDGNHLVVFAGHIPGDRHAQAGGNAGGGVARAEVIELTFTALEITGNAVLLAQGMELVVTTGNQFVGIGLVAHVPDHLVAIEVKGLIEGDC